MWPILVAVLGAIALLLLLALAARWHAGMVWRADRAFFRRLGFRDRHPREPS